MLKYGFDIVKDQYSFEYIYNLVYTEALNKINDSDEIKHDLDFIMLKLLEITTNRPCCNNPNGMGGLLKHLLNNYPQDSLDFITFNYDLMLEKLLNDFQTDSAQEIIFDINSCYCINFFETIDAPLRTEPFNSSSNGKSIKSYAIHNSKNDNRRYFLEPMIVPPTFDKNRFYSEILKPSWDAAQTKLSDADRIIVFGYSLPEADMKAHTLLLSALSQNKKNYSFEIIDTNPQICQRYIEKLPISSLGFYKSVSEFIKQNK